MAADILIELQHLPPIATLANMAAAHTVHLEACENYRKGTFRNRCHIATSSGMQRLSLPLRKGKHQQQPITEVQLSFDEPWPTKCWHTIQSAYGRAPFFEHYAPELKGLMEHPPETLWECNLTLLKFLYAAFGLRPNWTLTQTWAFLPAASVTDLRNGILPGYPVPVALFAPHPYRQVFEEKHGFLPNLSALDLLLCAGPHLGLGVLKASVPLRQ